jgi:cytochrome c oxidase subunit 3
MTEVDSNRRPQFDDLAQQEEAATMGIWIFLATEVLFFGGLFAAYTVYKFLYPEAFAQGSRLMKVGLGAINTAVLLTSSLTMALAVHAAESRNRKRLVGFLALTILLAAAFLGIKAVEYYGHIATEHLFPGAAFHPLSTVTRQLQLFFILYFVMTGLHAVHVLIGIGALAVIGVKAWSGRYTDGYSVPVHVTGLYWHFVDIVWIFLFPLLYLIGGH